MNLPRRIARRVVPVAAGIAVALVATGRPYEAAATGLIAVAGFLVSSWRKPFDRLRTWAPASRWFVAALVMGGWALVVGTSVGYALGRFSGLPVLASALGFWVVARLVEAAGWRTIDPHGIRPLR